MPSVDVAILMGSHNDWEIMQHAAAALDEFGVGHEVRVLSAHRTPDEALAYAAAAEGRGLAAIIAGAGGAAHLAGVLAAKTIVPVLGVPLPSSALNGMDALLATVQMPAGVPVATLAIGKPGALNAALLAVAIIATRRPELREKLHQYRRSRAQAILDRPDPRASP
jgi:5-(carboxyamino)imidazole ribonucleotide mutase